MVDDRKHDNRIPLNLTDREMLDASRAAARLDKSVGEYIRFVLRQSMYGTVGMDRDERNESRGSE
jgi:hypothetical protein